MEVRVSWSEPIEIFKPGKYNTDEKFIEHLRKFIEEEENQELEKKGIYIFLSGQIKPEEKLSVVILEGSLDHSVKEMIVKKKGHVRELKCLYKNYKDENLYIKVGTVEGVDLDGNIFQNIVCSLKEYVSPSCSEPCKNFEKVVVYNQGNKSPLHDVYEKEEE